MRSSGEFSDSTADFSECVAKVAMVERGSIHLVGNLMGGAKMAGGCSKQTLVHCQDFPNGALVGSELPMTRGVEV